MEDRIIIAGSRDFNDYDFLYKNIIKIIKLNKLKKNNITIISGGANGADKLGEIFAKKFDLKLIVMKPKWDLYGKRAGYIRNEEMAKYSMKDNNNGILIAFWNGYSRGTKSMINLAKEYNLKTYVFKYNK